MEYGGLRVGILKAPEKVGISRGRGFDSHPAHYDSVESDLVNGVDRLLKNMVYERRFLVK